MVDFDKFEENDYGLILEDGIFVIIGTNKGSINWYKTFNNYSFELYIKNKDEGLVFMGRILDEESLATILNLIEHGELLSNNIL